MAYLLTGLAAFILVHQFPFYGGRLRQALMDKLGKHPYRGLFALLIAASLYLIVIGWQAVNPADMLYTPPTWAKHATMLLVLVGMILFVASNAPTNIRRMIRHPQLIGVILWGIGHLIANGEVRSVILFGGMVFYGVISIIGSNKRDGEWVKRDKVPLSRDIVTVLIGLVVYAALLYFHSSFTGIAIMA